MITRFFTISGIVGAVIVGAVGFFASLAVAQTSSTPPAAEPAAASTAAPEPVIHNYPRVAETYRIGDNAYVRALAYDPSRGSIWVGTSLGAMEVDVKSRDLRAVYTRKEGLANEYVFAIGVDPDAHVWLGTNAGGVSKLVDGKWETYFPMHGLADYWIYSFVYDAKGNAWIGTWDGASYWDKATGKFTTYRQELINVWVYGLDIDNQGRVWFGTEGGVTMLDGETWRSWTHDDGLGGENIGGLPRNENTGLGTRSRHDLNVSDQNSGVADGSYNPNYVFAVHAEDDSDRVWFGTWGGGATVFDGETWKSYTTADGLAGNIVYSITREPNGTLWFGTNGGASRWDGENWVTYDRHTGLISNHVYAIVVDPEGMIWLGTKGGVTRIAPSGAAPAAATGSAKP